MLGEQLLDTNILVYAYTFSDVRKHSIAAALVEQIWLGGLGVTCFQNLCEFIFVVTRKVTRPLPLEDAEVILRDIFRSSHWKIIDRNQGTVEQAITRGKLYKVPFWDALIAAAMLENNLTTILTENERDFKRVPSLTVINPFKKS